MKTILIILGLVGMLISGMIVAHNRKDFGWILFRDIVLILSTISLWEGFTL